MPYSLANETCFDFAAALAGKQSVPGGGGAAAYAGALAVALCSMVGNFTTGKKTYAAYEEDVRRMLAEGEEVRSRLLALVDEDAVAFEPLSRAYGIPKSDPTRAQVLEEATRAACAAPLEMMRNCAKAIALLEEMAEKGSRVLASDVACGALLAKAALACASMNVYVNTKSYRSCEWARALEAECDALLSEWQPRAQSVADTILQSLRG